MAVIMASSTIPRSIGKRRWGSTTTSYIYSLGSIVNPSGVNWNPGGGYLGMEINPAIMSMLMCKLLHLLVELLCMPCRYVTGMSMLPHYM